MDLKFNNIDFKDLEINEIGNWPIQLRISIIAIVTLLGFILFVNILIMPAIDEISALKNKIVAMKQDYITKCNIAANLEQYKLQMIEMQKMYEQVLSQIPNNSKVPELIAQISAEASSEGLKYELIRPGVSSSKDNSFMELPISLKLIGTYHGFGRFLTRLAALDRVLTVHDFTISKINDAKVIKENEAYGPLILEMDIKAYWLAGEDSHA